MGFGNLDACAAAWGHRSSTGDTPPLGQLSVNGSAGFPQNACLFRAIGPVERGLEIASSPVTTSLVKSTDMIDFDQA